MASFDDLTQDIDECLEQFKTAVLGEDVRGALINAIKLCYHDVINYATKKVQKGDPGKSAYEIACEEGFSGSVEDWLNYLKGPKGDKGDKGDPGEVEAPELTVDGAISEDSPNPVQNRVIKAALDGKMDINFFPTSSARRIPVINNSGKMISSGKQFGSASFNNDVQSSDTYIPSEKSVRNYAYSKTESDSKYLTSHQDISGKANTVDVWNKTQSDGRYVKNSQIDSALSSTSENPVQNKVIKAALDSIGPGSSITVDDHLDQNSTNPVQNKVVKLALDDTASEERIYELIDTALSFDDPNNTFSTFNLNGLFVERYLDQNYSDSGTTKYRYYLTYIDSDSDVKPQPGDSHWHRIIELTGIFESNQWKCQNISNLPSDANPNKYYPSIGCMMNFIDGQLNGQLHARLVGNIDKCTEPDILYKTYHEGFMVYILNVDTTTSYIIDKVVYQDISRIQYGLIDGHLKSRTRAYNGEQGTWGSWSQWSQ